VGFTPGTGSALALLPAQNATGNWIKVVQRLPVRIEIPPAELEKHPLRVGLSMNVDVDVKDPSGAELGTQSSATYKTDVFAKYGDDADAAIARIIADNE
jgi:membrane fusion protein (multidrug efflux system)